MIKPGTNYFGKLKEYVHISQTNELGFAVIADCYGDPNVIALDSLVYNNGCFMFRNDILTGNSVYQNTGTVMNPSWALLSTGGGSGGFTYINEIVSGSGTEFTLAHVPVNSARVALYGGGSRLTPGVGNDYTITGATITMISSYSSGQVLADYS